MNWYWKVKLTLKGTKKNTVTLTILAPSFEEARAQARTELSIHPDDVARYDVTRGESR